MSTNRIQFISTTAEVAEAKSNLPDWQLPADERYFRRRICLMPNRANPGTAQNMCRTVIIKYYDVVLPGRNFVFTPRAVSMGIFV